MSELSLQQPWSRIGRSFFIRFEVQVLLLNLEHTSKLFLVSYGGSC